MTANNVPQDLAQQVSELRAQVANLTRVRSTARPRFYELADTDLSKVQDGQVAVYSSATGRWEPGDMGASGNPRFSLPGLVYVSTSGRDYPEESRTFTRIFVSLKVASTSGTTTVRLLRNGSAVSGTTVSLGVGVFTNGATFSQAFTGPETDYMQVELTAAGVTASDLVVQVS